MPRAVPRPDFPVLEQTVAQGVRVHDAKDVGALLKWTRGVRQLRQARAAEAMGVSNALLRGVEVGNRGVHFDTALSLLARLGYDVVLVPRDPKLAEELAQATAVPGAE